MDSDSGSDRCDRHRGRGFDELVFDGQASASTYTGTTGFVEVFRQSTRPLRTTGEAATGPIAKTTLLVPDSSGFTRRSEVGYPRASYSASKEATIEEAKILVYEVIP